MASGDQYGPALPPGMVVTKESVSRSAEAGSSRKRKGKILGPHLPPAMQKSSDSDEGPLRVKMDSEMSPEYCIQDDDDEEEEEEDDEEEDDEDDEDEETNQNGRSIGPMPSEMNQGGDNVVHATEEIERRSKRMKDKLTVKAEAEEGPSKREEWMTELPPEMRKNFGLQNRTFSKGSSHSEETKDRSSWTETPSSKKDKDNSRGKKRKRDEEKVVSVRDDQMRQQVEEYNKSKRTESLMDIHSKN
uniref:DUF3752 domain-containing protein n=1 Tax=Arion vulgaris TaxID=1028688 RepID=A0A0B7A7Y5_9EUPU